MLLNLVGLKILKRRLSISVVMVNVNNGIIKRLVISATEQFAKDWDRCHPWVLLSYRELLLTGLSSNRFEV